MSYDREYPEWRRRLHYVDMTFESFPPNVLIQKINDVCDSLDVPREKINIEFEYGPDDAYMVFSYRTPETEHEREVRVGYESLLEKAEREQLAHLKAKYENG